MQIQPNKDFLGAKESFHAEVSSLDTLLGYTEKDDREGMFEVSVFAELFREMLEARFGRGILRTLEVLEKEDRRVWPRSAAFLLLNLLLCLARAGVICLPRHLDLALSFVHPGPCMTLWSINVSCGIGSLCVGKAQM